MTDLLKEVQGMVEMECIKRKIPPKVIDEVQAIVDKAVMMVLTQVGRDTKDART